MKTPKTRLALSLTALAALFATQAAAAGIEEAVVPPSNSAATQYTETFPTSGGDKKTDQKPSHRPPSKVLGSQNAHKLEKQGPEGQAAAEAAAATAPTSIATPTQEQAPSSHHNGNGGSGHSGSAGGGGGGNGGGNTPSQGNDSASGTETAGPATEPTGSSGVGSAIGQATGLSSAGGAGPLLPLVILATILWALFYLWRQRRAVD
jgi:hypothetical protein